MCAQVPPPPGGTDIPVASLESPPPVGNGTPVASPEVEADQSDGDM